MKKLIILLAIAMGLSACAPKPTTIISSQDEPKENIAVSKESLVMLSRFDGEGLYVQEVTAGATALPYLAYLDVASATKVPLCNAPNCEHNTIACTAIWATLGDTYVYDDQLVFLSGGTASGYDSGIAFGVEFESSRVILADKTGGNRKTLCTIDDRMRTQLAPCAKYGDNILFFSDTDGGINMNSVNVGTGENTILTKIDYTSQFLGVFEDSFVIADYKYTNDDYVTNRVYLLNADDGAIKSIYEYKQALNGSDTAIRSYKYNNGKVYMLSTNTQKGMDILDEIDCMTGEVAVICEDIINESTQGQTIYAILNNTVVIDSPQNGEDKSLPVYRRFTYNLDTNVKGEITLVTNNPSKNFIVTVDIVSEIGDSLVVAHRYESVKKVLQDNAGTPYSVDTVNIQNAILSKADYLASTPNYIEIK